MFLVWLSGSKTKKESFLTTSAYYYITSGRAVNGDMHIHLKDWLHRLKILFSMVPKVAENWAEEGET